MVEANFQVEWLTWLGLLFRGVLKYSDYRKTREALAVSNQELAKAKAELNSCENSCLMNTRYVVIVGFLLLVVAVIAARRG